VKSQVLDKLLSKATKKRYKSTTEVLQDLPSKPTLTVSIATPTTVTEKELNSLRSKIVTVRLIVEVVIFDTALVAGIWFFSSRFLNFVHQIQQNHQMRQVVFVLIFAMFGSGLAIIPVQSIRANKSGKDIDEAITPGINLILIGIALYMLFRWA